MSTTTTPNFLQAALALLLLAVGALGGCFSSPTPHPGVEGEANGGRGDVTDPAAGVSDPDTYQDNTPDGPPCAPGDVASGDARADAADAHADANHSDANHADAAPHAPECGVTDPDPESDSESGGPASPAAGTGR